MIIGIFGFIGSGKNTVADYLQTRHSFKQMSWASSLKDTVSSVFNWDRQLLEGLTSEARDWREREDQWWSNRLGRKISPRIILQEWGTEVCRNHFHRDIWIASLENKIRNQTSNIVISDCRFANEQEAIKNLGGITIRVTRNPEPEWVKLAQVNFEEFLKQNTLVHSSEYSSVNLKYDHILDNNGTLEELQEKVNSLVEYLQVAR